jgi:hypothetical protein
MASWLYFPSYVAAKLRWGQGGFEAVCCGLEADGMKKKVFGIHAS